VVGQEEDRMEAVVHRTGSEARHMEAAAPRRGFAHYHNKEADLQVVRTLPGMGTTEVVRVAARSSDSLRWSIRPDLVCQALKNTKAGMEVGKIRHMLRVPKGTVSENLGTSAVSQGRKEQSLAATPT